MGEAIALAVPRDTARQASRALDRPWIAFGLLAALMGALLMITGQGLGFLEDDWAFITRPFTIEAALQPWGEHWSVLHFLIYRSVYELSGGSYAALHLTLVLIHIVAGAGLFALLRREAGDAYALGGSAIFLVGAAGYENVLWAFQIGFVLAVALGLWALYARDARVAGALLTAGVLTGGYIVPFVGAVGLHALLQRDRRMVVAAVIPATLYLAWLAIAGTSAQGTTGWSLAGLLDVPRYLLAEAIGIGQSHAGIGAIGPGLVGLAVLGVVVRPMPLTITAAVVILSYPVMLAVTRSDFAPTVATWPRQVYAVTPWIIVALSSLAAIARSRRSGRVAIVALFALLLMANLSFLPAAHDAMVERIAEDAAR